MPKQVGKIIVIGVAITDEKDGFRPALRVNVRCDEEQEQADDQPTVKGQSLFHEWMRNNQKVWKDNQNTGKVVLALQIENESFYILINPLREIKAVDLIGVFT